MAGFMRWLWIWGPAAAQMFAIFIASSIPDLTELPGQLSDKTGHFVGYAMLGALLLRGMAEARWDRVTMRRSSAALLGSAAYALTDEWHQRFVHGRSPEWADGMYDVAGAAVAVSLVLVVSFRCSAVLTLMFIIRPRRSRDTQPISLTSEPMLPIANPSWTGCSFKSRVDHPIGGSSSADRSTRSIFRGSKTSGTSSTFRLQHTRRSSALHR